MNKHIEHKNEDTPSLRLLKNLFDNTPDYSAEDNPDFHKIWEKLYMEINRRKRQRLYLLRGTAAALLALCIWGLSVLELAEKKQTTIYAYTTAKEIRQIKLPDGSQVTLNACSKISYPESFANKREVTLEGQAYFEVKKNPDAPFTVKTMAMDLEVLGTSFDMICYPEENIQETTLVTGSVKVGFKKNGEQLILSPNQKISYNKEKGTFSVNLVNARELSAWSTGQLIFDSAPLSEIIPRLEHWYDIEIIYNDDTIPNERFSFILKDDSLEYILDFICSSDKLSYKQEGRKVILSKQKEEKFIK